MTRLQLGDRKNHGVTRSIAQRPSKFHRECRSHSCVRSSYEVKVSVSDGRVFSAMLSNACPSEVAIPVLSQRAKERGLSVIAP